MSVLELKEITKSFANERVLRGISFHLASSQAISLLGPNGSGKTTLLSCIAGILNADSGSIERSFKKLGFLSADSMLYNDLSVWENLELYAAATGVDSQQVPSLAKRLSIEKFLNKKISECSLGMVKRASLARVLISAPELLLLDEPFSGLDRESVELICDLLIELRQSGVAMIIATHQVEIARRVCDQAVSIENGKLVELFI